MTASDRASRSTAALVGLSARELDVLTLMSDGLTNEAIAKRAVLSVKSVESVVRSVFLKLGLLHNPDDNRRVLAVRLLLEATQAGAASWPSYLSSFVGRSNELAELESLVATNRLVTIVGPGGIGKTRLAVELVDRVEPRPASVHYVDLCGVSPGGILGAALHACGIALTTEQAGWRQLVRFMSAEPRMIVIDNAETSIAEARALATRLAAAGPSHVLVTSREPLAVSGERLFLVPPLADEAAHQLLFERITDAGARPTTTEATAIGSIAQSLAGMPLAIELVAGRFISAEAKDVAARLTTLPELLRRPGVDRHASLGAALETSYGALNDGARRLFRLVSALRGGFTLDSLRRAVGPEWPELDGTLDQLVWSSLVGFTRGRYRVLEPVRQYAASLVDELGERAAVDALLVRYCVELADLVRNLISGPPESSMPRLLPDWDNCTAGIDAALAASDTVSALRICGSLAFWAARRPVSGIAIVERVLAELDGSEPALDRAWGFACLGCLSSLAGETERATQSLSAAIELFEAEDDRLGLMETLYWRAHSDGRADAIDRVIALAVETSSPYIEGWAYLLKASCLTYNGQLSPGATRIPFTDNVSELVERAEGIAARFGFSQLRSGVLGLRAEVRIIDATLGGAWSETDDLWPMIDEFEHITRSLGVAANIAEALVSRNALRVHRALYSEMRESLVEQLQLAALAESRRLVVWGVLHAASLLEHEDRGEHARELVAATMPTFCVYLDSSWIGTCLPSADLIEFALAHAEGDPLDAASLGSLVDRCRWMLALTSGSGVSARVEG